ncbi:class I SAM-dependent methyltransferase [Hyphobacterium sp. SN044]|uniref:DUF938 domain-containing protein n=1 Tax=Hyphobacterium sp. SN044 TaxID=2912575 RepID=UPI001F220DE8|nr:DUF938 domain-containing protein [Hyphobacterium sp. SN044]MCF8879279.1 class I SAM-dependent methyltransferase [Hyphobacterium sp. SN044]
MSPENTSPVIALEDRTRDAAKLYSPSAARNREPVRAVLAERLPKQARVLEIGSGTGEHGEACCAARPDISWQLTEIDPDSLASCAARAEESEGLLAPLSLDAGAPDWTSGLAPVDVLACLNVIHIAPWSVAEGLAAGAAKLIARQGFVFLYGPFLEGEKTAPSNREFDASLKSRNAEWGVRPIDAVTALFAGHGLSLAERIEMPANNLSLIFRRAS